MGHATALISLSLLTLLVGLGIAAYQLWSADEAQARGHRSALAARFGGRSTAARMEPVPSRAAPPSLAATFEPASLAAAEPAPLDPGPTPSAGPVSGGRRKSGPRPKSPTGTKQLRAGSQDRQPEA